MMHYSLAVMDWIAVTESTNVCEGEGCYRGTRVSGNGEEAQDSSGDRL